MNIFSIYKITNIVNHKIYIGFTSRSPSTRWKEHIKKSKGNSGSYLHNTIRKYDVDNFTFEVIYQSKDADHTLKVMESHFIEEYDSYGDNGYNLTLGGEGNIGYKPTAETRAKMSDAAKQNMTDETRAKMSAAAKNMTDETRAKMSDAKKGSRWMNNWHEVAQIKKHLVDEYLQNGWIFGRKLSNCD